MKMGASSKWPARMAKTKQGSRIVILNLIWNKVEIWFWTVLVGFMKTMRRLKMKSISRFLYSGLGVLLLVTICAAAWLAWQTTPMKAAAAPLLRLTHDLEWMKQAASELRQVNTLVVVVDHLPSRHPRLVGVWLVIADPGLERITWAPLFPLSPYGETQASNRLAVDFGLRANGELTHTFAIQVEQLAAPWQYTLILDRQALGELAGAPAEDAATVLRTMPWHNRVTAAEEQADLFVNLCQQTAPDQAEILEIERHTLDNLVEYSTSGKATPPVLSLLQANQCRVLNPNGTRPDSSTPVSGAQQASDTSQFIPRSAYP